MEGSGALSLSYSFNNNNSYSRCHDIRVDDGAGNGGLVDDGLRVMLRRHRPAAQGRLAVEAVAAAALLALKEYRLRPRT